MQKINVLLVYQEAEPLRSLVRALRGLPVQATRARSLAEAREALGEINPPHLVFTDTTFADGGWQDVVMLAARASGAAGVVVVGRVVDTRLYVDAIEAGAFDFIVPPFEAAAVEHVVNCAADHVLGERAATALQAQAPQKSLFASLATPALPAVAGSRSG